MLLRVAGAILSAGLILLGLAAILLAVLLLLEMVRPP